MVSKNSKSPIEAFISLSEAEKERVLAEYDQEFVSERSHPLSPEKRRQWQRIKKGFRRTGAPRGTRRISVSVERALLDRSDALAKRLGLSRAGIIARGLQAVLAGKA